MTKTISKHETELLSDAKVSTISIECLPFKPNKNTDDYTIFYSVKLEVGNPILYLAKNKLHPREVVAFYANGKMWASYGKNFKDAINGAYEDAIYYCW